MNAKNTPYVISQDIDILLAQWAVKHGFKIPNSSFFCELRSNFYQTMVQFFPNLIYVRANYLQNNLYKIIGQEKIRAVALDQVYFSSSLSLSLTRTVDKEFNDLGIAQRANELSLEKQLQKISKAGFREVVLVDDVIFSGKMIDMVRCMLQKKSISVPTVYACIGVGEGVNLLRNNGLQVKCVNYYPQVIDQVCERDFFIGVPSSGRTFVDSKGLIWGVPYIRPFGNPTWASIPKTDQSEYSRYCIKQSVILWQAIEEISSRFILCQDLPRPTIGFPVNNERFIELLKRHL